MKLLLLVGRIFLGLGIAGVVAIAYYGASPLSIPASGLAF